MRRKILAAFMLTFALIVGLSTAASAFFTASATSTQLASSATLGSPATVSAASAGATSLTVTVTAGSASPTPSGYAVYPHGSTTTPSCTVAGASGSCAVTGLTAGTTTSYDVYSTLGNWISSTSSPVSGTTVPAKPTSVAIAGTGFVNNTNKSNAEIDVTLPATSKVADTINVTVSDGTTTITLPVKSGTNGAGTVAFTGADLSSLANGPLTITAWSANSGGSSVVLTTSAVKDTGAPTPTVTSPAASASSASDSAV